jgi:hypothetical protein
MPLICGMCSREGTDNSLRRQVKYSSGFWLNVCLWCWREWTPEAKRKRGDTSKTPVSEPLKGTDDAKKATA